MGDPSGSPAPASGDAERDKQRLREDPAALAANFDRYRERLRRMIDFRLDPRLRGRVDASDVLQDAYLDAAQRLGHYLTQEEPVPVWIWLRQVASQRLVEVHRHHLGARMRDAGREVALDGANNGPAGADLTSARLVDHLAGAISSPSQQVVRGEVRHTIEHALLSMDPIDREVLALRHYEELGNREVAEVLGLSPTAASNRYVRALKRLREILTDELDAP